MSKIALTPNASGSGTFTIASPNSDTDRTLTLPDRAGTVETQGPCFSVRLENDQTVTTATHTLIQFDKVLDSAGNGWDETNKYFKPDVAGYYVIGGFLRGEGTVIANVILAYAKNSTSGFTQFIGWARDDANADEANKFTNGSGLVYLNGTTDYVSLTGYVEATGTPKFGGATNGNNCYGYGFLVRAS